MNRKGNNAIPVKLYLNILYIFITLRFLGEKIYYFFYRIFIYIIFVSGSFVGIRDKKYNLESIIKIFCVLSGFYNITHSIVYFKLLQRHFRVS